MTPRARLLAIAAASALAVACGSSSGDPAAVEGTDPAGSPTNGSTPPGSSGGGDGSSGGTNAGGPAPDGGVPGSARPAPGACAGVRDDFSAPQLDAATWRTVGFMGWTPEIVDGHLAFVPVASYNNTRTGVVMTRTALNLTGCAISVEVARALPANIKGELNFSLAEPSALMRISFGQLVVAMTVGGKAKTATIPYDPVAHRWHRFREQGGVLYLETSPDASTWTERLQGVPDASLTAVNVGLNVIDTSLTGVFEPPLFDNVNVAP